MANLVSRHLLNSISKITSKRNCPEIITFRYTKNPEQDEIKSKIKIPYDCDKVYLPDASDATKIIKILIIKSLNMFENKNETLAT
jgi:hypothetical protein